MLEEILRKQCKLDPHRPVVVGVSGGPDSLCLLGILNAAKYPVIIAHFNHHLRLESDDEARSVKKLAKKMNLPFASGEADVRGYAVEHTLSLEEAARHLRYGFLFATARKQDAQAVAVGHTADDQVETVLMHFLRGAGLSGLKGMEYRNLLNIFDPEIALVRPLLGLWRTDTETYCREHHLLPQMDPSNADQTYHRNRLRLTLIPELISYNPRIKDALLHTALSLQGDYHLLEEITEAAVNEITTGHGNGWISFDRNKYLARPHALRRNMIRRVAGQLRPSNRDFSFEAVDRAAGFIDSESRRQMDLENGLYLFIEKDDLFLATYEADLPTAHWPQISSRICLKVGEFCDLGDGWRLSLNESFPEDGGWRFPEDPWSAMLDADKTGSELIVRPRQAGDSFMPLGMNDHSVDLRKFFINIKLPRRARGKWPLVCVGNRIAWVPGFRLAHPYRITAQTRRALQIKLEKS